MKRGSVSSRLICWHSASVRTPLHRACSGVLLILAVAGAPLTWEWEPSSALRSWSHPALFAALYKLLAFLRLDTFAAGE